MDLSWCVEAAALGLGGPRIELNEPWSQLGGFSEPAGRASEPAGRALEPAGSASELSGRASEPAGRASEPAGLYGAAAQKGVYASRRPPLLGVGE